MSAHIAFYGSLRRGGGALEQLGLAEQLRFVSPCKIRGALFDLGDYPALVPGDAVVEADLFQMPEAEALAVLDEWEDYFPGQNAASIYIRKPTELIDPSLTADVYWFNRELRGAAPVSGGCWLAWRGLAQ